MLCSFCFSFLVALVESGRLFRSYCYGGLICTPSFFFFMSTFGRSKHLVFTIARLFCCVAPGCASTILMRVQQRLCRDLFHAHNRLSSDASQTSTGVHVPSQTDRTAVRPSPVPCGSAGLFRVIFWVSTHGRIVSLSPFAAVAGPFVAPNFFSLRVLVRFV